LIERLVYTTFRNFSDPRFSIAGVGEIVEGNQLLMRLPPDVSHVISNHAGRVTMNMEAPGETRSISIFRAEEVFKSNCG